ncbi:hypothetical protein HAX54_027409 [Datura stramonium]|uniref:Uncharacterized protein n=1 Tax=Datura stramonium TaxID=4076 RepID=A0ABS8V4E8_DATST|nr:hypothetical protein [Datura stramonium]
MIFVGVHASHYAQGKYDKLMKMMENPYQCNRLLELMEKEQMGESTTNMSKLGMTEPESMGDPFILESQVLPPVEVVSELLPSNQQLDSIVEPLNVPTEIPIPVNISIEFPVRHSTRLKKQEATFLDDILCF